MAKVSPWHSSRKTDAAVYHNDDKCVDGNNIEDKYRTPGTGGHPLCSRCSKL